MSYLVLARKYRPRNFEQMVGQPHVVQALTNALDRQRLHHAYLFTGTRGVGKTTVSRILAKSLNCVGIDGAGGITAQPCGRCQPCADIDSGRFVDYVELDAASNRGVEEISQLLEQAVYKPVVGRFKVYMIDEVHMLSNTAFNAMLKTLEEPPEYLKFVLATTDPQKVPVTVLSRCLQFNLRPMAAPTIEEHLARVAEAEGLPAERAALRLLSKAAHGSMRDALSLTDQAVAHGAGRLDEAVVREMLGAVDDSLINGLFEAIAACDAAQVVARVDALRNDGISAAGVLEGLAELSQRLALIQAIPTAALDGPDDLSPWADQLPAELLQLVYSIALHGRGELGLAPDEYGALLMVLLRMLAFMPDAGSREPPRARTLAVAPGIAAAVPSDSAEARAAPSAAPSVLAIDPRPSEAGAPPVPARAHSSAECGDRWAALVGRLIERGRIAALVRELAWQAECVDVQTTDEGERWVLQVEQQSLRSDAHRERLQAAMVQELGHTVMLVVQAGSVSDTPGRRESARRHEQQQAACELIETDPVVQALREQYKSARIVPGSIRPV